MNFNEALVILENDLKTNIGFVLPNNVILRCQFLVIMQEFTKNVFDKNNLKRYSPYLEYFAENDKRYYTETRYEEDKNGEWVKYNDLSIVLQTSGD